MIANSKISKKPKQFWERSEDLVLDFILYFVTTYIITRKYPIHVTWAQGKTPKTLRITWGSKNNYDKQFTTVTTKMFKTITIKNVHIM